MNRVQFAGVIAGHYEVHVNGRPVGRIYKSGGEVWCEVEGQFAGRFKYRRPMENAKSLIRFVLERMTTTQYLGRLSGGEAPGEVARSLGWESPNVKWVREYNERIARMNGGC